MIPPTCARDAGLFNAVLNVYFDPLTAKRCSFKEDEGVQNKKNPKKNLPAGGESGVERRVKNRQTPERV